MKNHINKLIIHAWRAFPIKRAIAYTGATAIVGMIMACHDCTAQSIEVQGKDSSWRLVGTVQPMTGFQIGAQGKVDFGGLFEKDDANAGVTGNKFGKWWGEIFSGGLEEAIKWLASLAVSDSGTTSSGDPSQQPTDGESTEALISSASSPSRMHWNWVDYIDENGPTVNYDEGAFFVVLTTNNQPPSKSDTSNQVAKPALFYWYKKTFDAGNNIAYDQPVWVWVKVHDGGHDPYSTSSFGDNHGSYTVSLDLGNKITDPELSARAAPINPKKGISLASLQAWKTKHKTNHTVMVLKRKTPSTRAH